MIHNETSNPAFLDASCRQASLCVKFVTLKRQFGADSETGDVSENKCMRFQINITIQFHEIIYFKRIEFWFQLRILSAFCKFASTV